MFANMPQPRSENTKRCRPIMQDVSCQTSGDVVVVVSCWQLQLPTLSKILAPGKDLPRLTLPLRNLLAKSSVEFIFSILYATGN
jgi:hypothetical protein